MVLFLQLVDNVVVNMFELDKLEICIGWCFDNDIQIDEILVSGYYVVIEVVFNVYLDNIIDYYIIDSDSINGIFVNEI